MINPHYILDHWMALIVISPDMNQQHNRYTLFQDFCFEYMPALCTGQWGSRLNCTYPPSEGCAITAEDDNTFGYPFNDNGGGVFATELNDNIGIKMWFWLHERCVWEF